MKNGNQIGHVSGFTIIELMVTLAITSFLVLGATTFLASAHQTNRVQAAVSGLSSDGRSSLDRMTRDIRMSGYRDSDWSLGALTNAISADAKSMPSATSVGAEAASITSTVETTK